MRKKYKIAYISHFSNLQMGGQRSTYFLIENINRELYEPILICPEKGEFSEKCSELGIKSYFINLLSIKPKHYFELFKEYHQIRKLIENLDVDIVHVDRDADVFITNLAKRGTKAKTIWHIRINGANFFDRFNAKYSDGIIGVSEAAKNRVKVKYLDKYKTIYNGVDLNVFKPPTDKLELRHKLGMPEDKFILIFVGQLNAAKGIFDIIEALNIIKSRGYKLPLTLLIGTAKNNDILKSLHSRLNNYSLEKDCIIFPQQNNIHKWMQLADALIIPSYPGIEGLPRVMFEAMACGCVVIGSNTPGIKEIIEDNYGLLVNAGEPDSIAETINLLMKDEDLQIKLKLKGRIKAEELFDIKKHTIEVEKFYQEILGIL